MKGALSTRNRTNKTKTKFDKIVDILKITDGAENGEQMWKNFV